MSVAENRQEFIARMRQALNEDVPSQPSPDQLRRYFRSLSNNPQEAIDAYRSYASLFYIHTDSTSNPQDIVYPGGPSGYCDSWNEVLAIQPNSSGRRVIDCEGFAVMGVELLREAGFQFVRYMVAVPPTATQLGNWSGHVFAHMRAPNGQDISIGNDNVYYSATGAVQGIVGWSLSDETNVRYGSGGTVQEAMESARDIVRERQENRLWSDPVLLPPRRSSSPSVRNP